MQKKLLKRFTICYVFYEGDFRIVNKNIQYGK